MPRFAIAILCLLFTPSVFSQSQNISLESRGKIEGSLEFWENYGDRCNGFPSKLEEHGSCDDGDAVLFNGLLCLSGYQPGCDTVRLSQSENGQWWRSPRQTGGDIRENNSFSRDMASGVLLYLLKTEDQSAAMRWYEWIKSNRKPVLVGPLKLGKVSRLCHDEKDNTCIVSPAIWENMGRVFSAIGLPLQNSMRNPYAEFGELGIGLDKILGAFDKDWEDVARLEVKNAKPGYRMHLKGVLALIAKTINEQSGEELYDWRPLARDLHALQPANLFFEFLANGSSDLLTDKLIASCPTPATLAPKREWAWERSDESAAWQRSMGWDCLFLGRLML